MKLEVNGIEYTNFISASAEIRLDSLSNQFSFQAAATEGQALPFKGGEACAVIVGDEKVITGFIEIVSVDYDGLSHTINISGRDKTADLLDSALDVVDDIRGEGLTLKGLIEIVIKSLNLDISVIDEVSPKPFTSSVDIAAPEPGDNAFEFIEKYSTKRQVLLTSNADGDIVITKNSGIHAAGAVQHIIGAEDNNVMSSSFSYDTTGRFNKYKMVSDLAIIPLNTSGEHDAKSITDQSGASFDNDIRKSRVLVLRPSTSFPSDDCTERTKWEADIRKARGLIYSAAVPLFRVGGYDGALWKINRLYQIRDDFLAKNETMLCNSVTFSLNEDGRNTSLGFVGEKAYTTFVDESGLGEVAGNVA